MSMRIWKSCMLKAWAVTGHRESHFRRMTEKSCPLWHRSDRMQLWCLLVAAPLRWKTGSDRQGRCSWLTIRACIGFLPEQTVVPNV